MNTRAFPMINAPRRDAAGRHLEPFTVAPARWPDVAPHVPSTAPDHPVFVGAAGRFGRRLPATVFDALVDFADEPHASGALLLRGVPAGDVPATPPTPIGSGTKDFVSEFVLLAIARRLGQPVGYLPELGGRIVQNIVPVQSSADRQISTSSKVELMYHTEAAFHPHRPRYLVLFCLRGDPTAATTLASIREVQHRLPHDVRTTLFEPRFRTAVDESYLGTCSNRLGQPTPVLSGPWERPRMVFDADLMVGTDLAAERALRLLGEAVAEHHTAVVLEAGDVLVVDNDVAVHGRTPFAPRFDGTDRWLQRTFVVADLGPSAGERTDRVITTTFD
jgi:hypothetical protein